jgi:hypothetical protein
LLQLTPVCSSHYYILSYSPIQRRDKHASSLLEFWGLTWHCRVWVVRGPRAGSSSFQKKDCYPLSTTIITTASASAHLLDGDTRPADDQWNVGVLLVAAYLAGLHAVLADVEAVVARVAACF